MPRIPAFAALTLLLAACGDTGSDTDATPRDVAAVGDAAWRLVSVNGEELETDKVRLKISGGFLSGQGPCNTINANYLGEAPAFQIETLITTKMVCDQIGLENRVVEALLDTRQAVVEGGRPTLTGEDNAILVFVPAG